MTLVSAARVLGLSERQVRRLLDRIRTNVRHGIRHKPIGRPSNNRIGDGVRDYAVALIRERTPISVQPWQPRSLPNSMAVTVPHETYPAMDDEAGIWFSRKQAPDV